MEKRFIVVMDLPSGMAQLENIWVGWAKTEEKARERAAEVFQTTALPDLHVFALDNIGREWTYYR